MTPNILVTPGVTTHHKTNQTLTNFITKILEGHLFAFAYRLFREDFSSTDGALRVFPNNQRNAFSCSFICPQV